MTVAKVPDADFIRLFNEIGPVALAKRCDSQLAGVQRRRRHLERKHGIVMTAPGAKANSHALFAAEAIPGRLHMAVHNGVVLIGSDLHAWPGKPSTAFRAFVKFIKDMQPKAVIMNGDVIDGASVSRHPPLGWEKLPSLIEEIEAAQELLHQIETVAPKAAQLLWPAGNHDARFSIRLATVAPEYARIHGTHLKDHFGPRWQPCWSVWINDGETIVKHRARGGIHASYTSTLHGGKTIVHGHLHKLQVSVYVDYNGRRWGVDCGCLADIYGPQFAYSEDNTRNWSSGFAVLTFKDSQLLQPELCVVHSPGVVEFRGERIKV